MSYKVEAVAQLAQEIKAAGFRVFLAKSGTHGIYTDAEGTKVVSFQFDLGGFKFTGNYKTDQPRQTGTGWGLEDGSFQNMFNQYPPQWAVRGANWKYTTLAQHQATYQASSQYTELSDVAIVHYGMTEAQARRKAGSNGSFEGPLPLCGNGSYHVAVTSDTDSITCEACKAVLKTRPGYL
jgi:hypothetical protein